MSSPNYSGPITTGTDTSVSTAQALIADTPCRAVVVQADPENTADVLIGDSAAQTLQLQAGQSISLRVRNLDQIFVAGASGTQTVHWITEH